MNYIKKASLAKELKVSVKTIYNYEQIAINYTDDFYPDYPVVEGSVVTNGGFTHYQSWVISDLIHLSGYMSRKLIKHYLTNNPERFSKKTYQSGQSNEHKQLIAA